LNRDWSIRNIYFYLICLVTLFLVVGGFIAAAQNAAEILLPGKPNVPLMHLYYPEYRDGKADFNPPPPAELEARRQQQEIREGHYHSYIWRRLLNSIALMIIPIPFYLYHWRQVKPSLRRRAA
jgi:hypothetical protein